jgi:hypothetical protein
MLSFDSVHIFNVAALSTAAPTVILLANSIEDCNQRWGSSGRRDVSCEPGG